VGKEKLATLPWFGGRLAQSEGHEGLLRLLVARARLVLVSWRLRNDWGEDEIGWESKSAQGCSSEEIMNPKVVQAASRQVFRVF